MLRISRWPFLLGMTLAGIVEAAGPSPIRFLEVASEAGVTLRNLCGSPDKAYIVEANGNGAAFFDYDEDGDQDLLVTNGSTLEQLKAGGSPMATLYRNDGNGRFSDVSRSARLAKLGWAVGVCVADYDNDGLEDVYVTAYGPNVLFRNRGDGTFEEKSDAGASDERYGTGCSFGDFDGDGALDLYVANYLTFEPARALERETPDCQFMGVSVMCGPRHFPGEPDVLYRNQGNGSFADITARAGIHDPGYYGFGVVSGDLDDDGSLDVYVANDSRPNFLFLNRGDGTFSEEGLVRGVALSEEGRAEAGMGVDLGDYNRDGRFDILVTNFSHESHRLYRGGSEGSFTDVSFTSGFGGPTLPFLGWGVGFVDLDNDGWLDVFVANGHVYPEVDDFPLGTTYAQTPQVFRNLRDGRFGLATVRAGEALSHRRSGRGVAFGDYDDDGDLDVLVVNLNDRPSLFRNEVSNRNHWLRVRLIGGSANRSAVGSRVTLSGAGGPQVAEVRSGGSYLSHNDSRLHFGLGEVGRVDRLQVRWPGGRVESWEGVSVDSQVTLVEGVGIVGGGGSR